MIHTSMSRLHCRLSHGAIKITNQHPSRDLIRADFKLYSVKSGRVLQYLASRLNVWQLKECDWNDCERLCGCLLLFLALNTPSAITFWEKKNNILQQLPNPLLYILFTTLPDSILRGSTFFLSIFVSSHFNTYSSIHFDPQHSLLTDHRCISAPPWKLKKTFLILLKVEFSSIWQYGVFAYFYGHDSTIAGMWLIKSHWV